MRVFGSRAGQLKLATGAPNWRIVCNSRRRAGVGGGCDVALVIIGADQRGSIRIAELGISTWNDRSWRGVRKHG
jgi:hypothetical protein